MQRHVIDLRFSFFFFEDTSIAVHWRVADLLFDTHMKEYDDIEIKA